MYAGHRTYNEIQNVSNVSQSHSKDVLADINRFLKKRATKMARDSEMSRIDGLISETM